ncbi:hypothetical protein BDR06DRAFT_249312 [Suillus hirtellus]|nr:hypothetical protein BDR06DRAFT_249312 [Suillus hirtellus]
MRATANRVLGSHNSLEARIELNRFCKHDHDQGCDPRELIKKKVWLFTDQRSIQRLQTRSSGEFFFPFCILVYCPVGRSPIMDTTVQLLDVERMSSQLISKYTYWHICCDRSDMLREKKGHERDNKERGVCLLTYVTPKQTMKMVVSVMHGK